ncbi:MAG: EamA family transporter [Candidatus Pacebacteria bacterium]|nr:EamA family transporter [Candidatus Paceibacterota bacterium]
MFWLIIIILAYFFLALSSLGDKLYLKGKEDPKTYVFYVGLLGGLLIFLIPFLNLSNISFIWPALEGVVYICALYALYYALDKFEVSTIVPGIGGLQPIFILLLTIVFFGITVSIKSILALIILIIGTFLISMEKGRREIKNRELLFCVIPAVLFAGDFILTKQVFNVMPFLEGIVLMRIFSFLAVLIFLFDKKFRKNIFKKKKNDKKLIFLGTQLSGGVGILLQSYAISLVPVMHLATLNALKGIQYIFLIFITFIISTFYSKLLKESFSKKSLIRKIISIVFIVIGIALLAI